MAGMNELQKGDDDAPAKPEPLLFARGTWKLL